MCAIETEVVIERVSYGKTTTLPQDREYRVKDQNLSPVGTLADWIAWATDLIIPKRVRVIDKVMGEDYLVKL